MFPFKVDAHQAAVLLPEQEVIGEHVPVHVEGRITLHEALAH